MPKVTQTVNIQLKQTGTRTWVLTQEPRYAGMSARPQEKERERNKFREKGIKELSQVYTKTNRNKRSK